MIRNHLATVAAIVSGLLIASSSVGAKSLPATPPNTPNNAASAAQQRQEQTAALAHNKAVDEAQQALTDAQAAFDAVVQKAQTQFEASPDYTAAATEVSTDQKAYDAAAANVLQQEDMNSTYSTAKSENTKAQAELADLKANSGSSDDDITAKATEVMQTGSVVHKIESAALAGDPTTVAAHAKLLTAQQAMDALNTDFQKKLAQTPEYVAAKSAVDAADKRVIEAEKAHPASVAAVTTVKGKITSVGDSTISISVVNAKKVAHTVTVNYAADTTITGTAAGTIDKSAVGRLASVTGTESGNSITASSIAISAAPKKKPGAQ